MRVIQEGAERRKTGSDPGGGDPTHPFAPGGAAERAAPEIDLGLTAHHALANALVLPAIRARWHVHFHSTGGKRELFGIEAGHGQRLSNEQASCVTDVDMAQPLLSHIGAGR